MMFLNLKNNYQIFLKLMILSQMKIILIMNEVIQVKVEEAQIKEKMRKKKKEKK